MELQYVKTSVQGPVGWLEYNRPPINAFDWQLVREVPAAFQALVADPAVRVIVFASALEKHFSAGAELAVFGELNREQMREWLEILHGLVRAMRASPKPLLAAVHGLAVGGGLEVVLHCDVRFAAEDARFGLPEVNLGILPPVATSQSLPRLLGRARAIRFLYEGTLVDAREARAMGLADLLCPPGQLRAEVQTYAAALAGKPPEALAAIRRTITAGMNLSFEAGLKMERETVLDLGETENFAEGVRAFLQKRKPNWR